MRRRALWTMFLVALIVGCNAAAWGTNSVVVESKTVNKGDAGVVVGIKITNDLDLAAIVLPLILRSVTPGTFITALTASGSSVRNPDDRLSLTSGTGALQGIKTTNRYASDTAGSPNCKDGQPGGFTVPVAASYTGPWTSPAGVFMVCGQLDPTDPADPLLAPGTDVTAAGALKVTVSVNTIEGWFEIDTTCTTPANHLTFSDTTTGSTGTRPAFTKGVITIGHPPVARDTSWTTLEDTPRNVTYLPASDLDGDPLTFSISVNPQHGVVSGFIPASGAFTYTPAPNYFGPDSLKFEASDGAFPAASGTVRITVTPVNDAPIARDTAIVTDEDVAVNAQLQAFDPDGDALTYSKLTGPFHGTVTGLNAATGTFTYTPSLHYFGPDSITFRAKDAVLNSNTATVRITVNWVNSPPVARDSTIATGKNTAVPGKFQSYDIDGQLLTFTVVSGPFNGTMSGFNPNTGQFTYTPFLDVVGKDSIKFQSNDGLANSNIGTVRISVTERACFCEREGDVNRDGVRNVNDVIHEINVVFNGNPYALWPPCPVPYEEMTCNCQINVLDVIYLINYIFNYGPAPCKLCESACY